jgi:hypothetical protein
MQEWRCVKRFRKSLTLQIQPRARSVLLSKSKRSSGLFDKKREGEEEKADKQVRSLLSAARLLSMRAAPKRPGRGFARSNKGGQQKPRAVRGR